MTVRGTVHVSQSDFSLLYPHVCSLLLKMVAHPRRALDININASFEFLDKVLPSDIAAVNRAYKNEGFLESDMSPLDRIPSTQIHKPRDKFTAARLKIRHEWIYRTSPTLFRKLKRSEAKRKGKPPETGDEVWLHVKPMPESIARRLPHVSGGSTSSSTLNVPVFGDVSRSGDLTNAHSELQNGRLPASAPCASAASDR